MFYQYLFLSALKAKAVLQCEVLQQTPQGQSIFMTVGLKDRETYVTLLHPISHM